MSKDLFFEMAVNVRQTADAFDAMSAAMNQLTEAFTPVMAIVNPKDWVRMNKFQRNRNMVTRLRRHRQIPVMECIYRGYSSRFKKRPRHGRDQKAF